MITEIDKIYINSINQNIELSIDQIKKYNYLSVTGITINNFYQIQNQTIILNEGNLINTILMNNKNYQSKNDMMKDLENNLNTWSPRHFTYTVSDWETPDVSGLFKIVCSDIVMQKSLTFSDNLKELYGFEVNINGFTGTLRNDFQYNLYPISDIFIRTNMMSGVQQNNQGSNILCIFDTRKIGEFQKYDILTSLKRISQNNYSQINFTDYFGNKVNINGSFIIELSFVKLENLDFIKQHYKFIETYKELKLQD